MKAAKERAVYIRDSLSSVTSRLPLSCLSILSRLRCSLSVMYLKTSCAWRLVVSTIEPGGTLYLLLRLRAEGGSLKFLELRGLTTESDKLISFYLGSLACYCLGVDC